MSTARAVSLFTSLTLVFLNLPILVIAFMSFARGPFLSFPPAGFSLHWYGAYLGSARWMGATFTSLEVAAATACLAILLGTAGAFGLVRSRMPFRPAANALVNAPLVVPGIVSAVGLYFFFARFGLIGTRLSLILAHTALAVPLVVVNVTTALKTLDQDLERAARGLGASRAQVFVHVTFPLLRPAILTGGLLAFLFSFDELVVALFIAGVDTTTLPIRLWNSLRDEVDPTVAAASTLLILLSIACVAIIEFFRQRAATSVPGGF
jgi:putative spermidine/putrescine transport system permease protein